MTKKRWPIPYMGNAYVPNNKNPVEWGESRYVSRVIDTGSPLMGHDDLELLTAAVQHHVRTRGLAVLIMDRTDDFKMLRIVSKDAKLINMGTISDGYKSSAEIVNGLDEK